MTPLLVLASASPARAATLRGAGIIHEVVVSDVDEDAVLAAALATRESLSPGDQVLTLARAKARAVATHHPDALVLGCDSMFEMDDVMLGKPGDAQTARERWRSMRGRTGTLHTGHWLVAPAGHVLPTGEGDAASTEPGPSRAQTGAVASTTVHVGKVSDEEIEAYVATGEPARVAGGFTLDGFGGPFISGVEGDPHTVVGLSLPLLRQLLHRLGIPLTSLWRP